VRQETKTYCRILSVPWTRMNLAPTRSLTCESSLSNKSGNLSRTWTLVIPTGKTKSNSASSWSCNASNRLTKVFKKKFLRDRSSLRRTRRSTRSWANSRMTARPLSKFSERLALNKPKLRDRSTSRPRRCSRWIRASKSNLTTLNPRKVSSMMEVQMLRSNRSSKTIACLAPSAQLRPPLRLSNHQRKSRSSHRLQSS